MNTATIVLLAPLFRTNELWGRWSAWRLLQMMFRGRIWQILLPSLYTKEVYNGRGGGCSQTSQLHDQKLELLEHVSTMLCMHHSIYVCIC